MIKIIKSLSVIAFVAAIAVAGTSSYFSDTEKSEGNIMKAGSLDLTLNDQNGGVATAVVDISDMKPCQTKYSKIIKLHIDNNPGKLYKHIVNGPVGVNPLIVCDTGDLTEPECEKEGGTWNDDGTCTGAHVSVDYLPRVTWFDLEMWVPDSTTPVEPSHDAPMCGTGSPVATTNCWDVLIPDGVITVDQIASRMIYLGGLTGVYPVGSTVIIRQSFHMMDTADNEYQGDKCVFTEEFKVIQENADDPANVCTPDPDPSGDGCLEL